MRLFCSFAQHCEESCGPDLGRTPRFEYRFVQGSSGSQGCYSEGQARARTGSISEWITLHRVVTEVCRYRYEAGISNYICESYSPKFGCAVRHRKRRNNESEHIQDDKTLRHPAGCSMSSCYCTNSCSCPDMQRKCFLLYFSKSGCEKYFLCRPSGRLIALQTG